MNEIDQDVDQETSEDAVAEKPLAPEGWSKPPSLMELKQDLSNAKQIHDGQVLKITDWLDNLNVTGKAKPKPVKGRSSIQPKLIRRQAEWRYAALSEPFLSTDDVFKVRPVTWEDRDAAQQNEMVLNWQLNTKVNKVKFIDDYVRTAVDEGTVIVWVGWEFLEEEYEATVPDVRFVINPALAPLHQQLEQMKQESPSQYDTDVPDELKEAHDLTMEHGDPIEPQIVGQKTVTKKRTLRNCPTLEVMDFRNVVLDPTAMGDPEKASFVIRSFESSIAELEKTGLYKHLDKVNVTGNSILSTPDHQVGKDAESQTFNFEDRPRQKVIVFEYWGKRSVDGTNKLTSIVAAWVGDTLIRMEESPHPDKSLPVVVEQYLPVRRSNYGEPDGALLEDNQKVVGAVTRGMIDLLGRSANAQQGMSKNLLDATNKRKFERGEDYEYNPNSDPKTDVYLHEYPEIPQSAPFMLQLMNMDAESLTGVKAFSGEQGLSGSALGDVAAAVRGALDAASKRELGILRRLAGGMVKIGRKLIAMNAEYLSDEEVIRVTNEKFVKVRREDLAGNFDLRLSISTAEEDNNKAQQLAFMFQTIGPKGDQGLVNMILADIARLRKMPDLAKKIENYQPQPDPLLVQEQQLKIQLLQAQIAQTQAQTAKDGTHAQLNQAKVGTEEAKAGHLKSDTDLKNLDFVEQESGTKHAREIDKVGEQARSQEHLALVQHDLNQRENVQDRQFDLVQEYVKSAAKKNSSGN
jgi:hypothetical protein